MTITLDANVLVYSVDIDAGAKHEAAKNLVEHLALSGSGMLIDQCLFEFLNAAVNKRKQPFDLAADSVRKWAAAFDLVQAGQSIIQDTLALLSRYKLSVWDARILAVCVTTGCEFLLSEDMQDGANYGGVTMLNPFKPANATRLAELLGP